jgi:hypothetical protein
MEPAIEAAIDLVTEPTPAPDEAPAPAPDEGSVIHVA